MLRKLQLCCMVMLLFPGAALAFPECHFDKDVAVLCRVGEVAADAYTKIGTSEAALSDPYNQRMLHEAGCMGIYGAQRFHSPIVRVRSVRIAEPRGSVRALYLFLKIDGQTYDMWTADQYLAGICPRYAMGDEKSPELDAWRGKIECHDPRVAPLVEKGISQPDSVSDKDYKMALEGGQCTMR